MRKRPRADGRTRPCSVSEAYWECSGRGSSECSHFHPHPSRENVNFRQHIAILQGISWGSVGRSACRLRHQSNLEGSAFESSEAQVLGRIHIHHIPRNMRELAYKLRMSAQSKGLRNHTTSAINTLMAANSSRIMIILGSMGAARRAFALRMSTTVYWKNSNHLQQGSTSAGRALGQTLSCSAATLCPRNSCGMVMSSVSM